MPNGDENIMNFDVNNDGVVNELDIQAYNEMDFYESYEYPIYYNEGGFENFEDWGLDLASSFGYTPDIPIYDDPFISALGDDIQDEYSGYLNWDEWLGMLHHGETGATFEETYPEMSYQSVVEQSFIGDYPYPFSQGSPGLQGLYESFTDIFELDDEFDFSGWYQSNVAGTEYEEELTGYYESDLFDSYSVQDWFDDTFVGASETYQDTPFYGVWDETYNNPEYQGWQDFLASDTTFLESLGGGDWDDTLSSMFSEQAPYTEQVYVPGTGTFQEGFLENLEQFINPEESLAQQFKGGGGHAGSLARKLYYPGASGGFAGVGSGIGGGPQSMLEKLIG